MTSTVDPETFVLAATAPGSAPLVPEITLQLATELTPLWQATELFLETANVSPPFWAFAWPGAQALARHVLDAPELVRGRRVLDFAAGCGLAAIAAARAGAASVDASEIDPLAVAAIAINARRNGAAVRAIGADLVCGAGTDRGPAAAVWDVVLCGDVCYEAPMTSRILPWLQELAAAGATVLIADPGRDYLPRAALLPLGIAFDVPTTRELEDRDFRRCVLYRLR